MIPPFKNPCDGGRSEVIKITATEGFWRNLYTGLKIIFSTIRFLYNSQRKSTSMCISNTVEDKQQLRTEQELSDPTLQKAKQHNLVEHRQDLKHQFTLYSHLI